MDNKIVIAMDSFKGSATSLELGEWVKQGILRVDFDADISVFSVADGGEGTLETLVKERNGRFITKEVIGPLGDKVSAQFGIIDENIAIIEMAESSGISLTNQTEEDALKATTYGVGELVLAALDENVETIFIGIGGSATTDGGAGFAQAIGAKLTDEEGHEVKAGSEGLKDIKNIDLSNLDERLEKVSIKILSDVTNPLIGKNGAAYIYGPQKGLPDERLEEVDEWLHQYGQVVEKHVAKELIEKPGAGAAGGLGFGILAFTNAELVSGIEEILKIIKVESKIKDADLVITGEGRIDNQSVYGKTPTGVAKIAEKYQVPVIAIVGSRENNLSNVFAHGIDLVLTTLNEPMDLKTAFKRIKENAIMTGETAMRAYLLNKNKKGDK